VTYYLYKILSNNKPKEKVKKLLKHHKFLKLYSLLNVGIMVVKKRHVTGNGSLSHFKNIYLPY
jgi:hypothetical protein